MSRLIQPKLTLDQNILSANSRPPPPRTAPVAPASGALVNHWPGSKPTTVNCSQSFPSRLRLPSPASIDPRLHQAKEPQTTHRSHPSWVDFQEGRTALPPSSHRPTAPTPAPQPTPVNPAIRPRATNAPGPAAHGRSAAWDGTVAGPRRVPPARPSGHVYVDEWGRPFPRPLES